MKTLFPDFKDYLKPVACSDCGNSKHLKICLVETGLFQRWKNAPLYDFMCESCVKEVGAKMETQSEAVCMECKLGSDHEQLLQDKEHQENFYHASCATKVKCDDQGEAIA